MLSIVLIPAKQRNGKIVEKGMSINPIKAIEDTNALKDLGKMGHYMYMGAREEGASEDEAISVVFAYFVSLNVAAAQLGNEEKKNEEDNDD